MVSADFLRNVPIIRYLHLSTTTHTFLVFYSLDRMHCTPSHWHYASRPGTNAWYNGSHQHGPDRNHTAIQGCLRTGGGGDRRGKLYLLPKTWSCKIAQQNACITVRASFTCILFLLGWVWKIGGMFLSRNRFWSSDWSLLEVNIAIYTLHSQIN